MKISTMVAFAAVVAVGCGANNNPKKYVMSFDTQNLDAGTLATSCYPAYTGTGTVTESDTNGRGELDFEIWTSADGKTTELVGDSGVFAALIGDAAVNTEFSTGGGAFAATSSTLDSVIESTDGKTFKLSFSDKNAPDSTDFTTDTATLTITFTDTTYTKGTISVTASRDCGGDACVAAEKFSCAPAVLPFISSQVTGNNEVNF